jgi:hypothetical protein
VFDAARGVDLATLLGAALTAVLSISPPQLTMGDFRQPLLDTSTFQVAKLRGFPTSANFESKLSVSNSDVVVEEWNPEQLLDMAAGSGPLDRACIVHDRMNELLIKQLTISDGQAASPVKEGAKHVQSLSYFFLPG